MNILSINQQANVMYNKVNQKNLKINTNNVNAVTFNGAAYTPKTNTKNIMVAALAAFTTMLTAIKIYSSTDKEFNRNFQKRLKSMNECDSYGKVQEYISEYDKKILKKTYIKNPELTKQLMNSTLKDGHVIWPEYSADAIYLIVENNKEHPEKTELLKKCLSRSYEFNESNYKVIELVNKYPQKVVQKALIEAGYQENKAWNYPETFYSPFLFTKQFNK